MSVSTSELAQRCRCVQNISCVWNCGQRLARLELYWRVAHWISRVFRWRIRHIGSIPVL
jgi:hypothetical protein